MPYTYFLRVAAAGALLGAFLALLVTPAVADVMAEKKLPHQWEAVVIGDGHEPTACGVRSTFTSIGTSPRALPKGKDVVLILGKSYNHPGAMFGMASDFWAFPDGYKAELKFSWDNEDKVYSLNIEVQSDDPTMIVAEVADHFLDDFAKKGMMTISINGEIIGGFPLVGSRIAVNELRSCQSILPELESGTPGWGGNKKEPEKFEWKSPERRRSDA